MAFPRLRWMRQNKLFETTDVSGFGLIHNANNKFEVVLWYVAISLCFFFTFKNVYDLLEQYNSAETVTSLKIGRSELSLFPKMTFCIQMKMPEINKELLSRYRKKKLSAIANISSVKDDVMDELEKLTSKEKFLNTRWHYVFLPLLFRYFTSIRLLEVNPRLLSTSPDRFSSTAIGLKAFINKNGDMSTVAESIFSILNHSRNLGINDVELLDKYSDELIKFSNFRIRYTERNLVKMKTKRLKPELKLLFYKPSELEIQGFCFNYKAIHNISLSKQNEENMDSRLTLDFNLHAREKLLGKTYGFGMKKLSRLFKFGGKFDEENMEKLEVYLGDEHGANQFLAYPAITAAIGTTVRSHIVTTAVYNSIIRCSESQTKDQCIIECKSKIIRKECNCTSLLFLKMLEQEDRNKTTDLCKLETYFDCLNESMIVQYNRCIKSCESACKTAIYNLIPHRTRQYANYEKSIIYIHRKLGEYPIFEESYAQSPESLFGELGGTLDFYLGISVLAILHMLFYIVKQIIYLFKKDTKTGKIVRGLTDEKRDQESIELVSNGKTDLEHIQNSMRRLENEMTDLNEKVEERLRNVENMMRKLVSSVDNDARGLGMERLFLQHLKLYSDPKVLVLVINTLPQDEGYFVEHLKNEEIEPLPKFITSDISVNDRKAVYLEGGIQFITSRILVVDLLMDRIPVHFVSGIVVYHAHQLLDSFQESFILRLYREKKPDGFIKAFTDHCNSSQLGSLGQLQRLVTRLYVKRVEIIPRFEADIKRCLAEAEPQLIEVTVELNASMRKLQTCLSEVIRACLRELRQCKTFVETEQADEDLTLVGALYESEFERKLKPVIEQLPDKPRRLMEELQKLRQFLRDSEEIDPLSVYKNLEAIRSNKEVFTTNSGWLFTATAAEMFTESRKLVGICEDDESTNTTTNVAHMQAPPKWAALKSVLDEIRESYSDFYEKYGNDTEIGNVLLLTANKVCCRQISDLINIGSNHLIWRLHRDYHNFMSTSDNTWSEPEPPVEPWWSRETTALFGHLNEEGNVVMHHMKLLESVKLQQQHDRRQKRKEARTRNSKRKSPKESGHQLKLTEFTLGKRPKLNEDEESSAQSSTNETEKLEDSDETPNDALLVIKPLGERYQLLRTLEMLKPSFVILYHIDLAAMRQLEIYKATHPERPFRIYLLMYRESTEERRYLMSLRNENDTFERLIQEKGSLLIPREYDLTRDPPMRPQASSRQAGGRKEDIETPKIVVDMREFQSELPLVIYKRGIDIVPVTLEVGDYILTPDICVERKSLDDLTQSLQHGRLFSQAEKMLRHYPKSLLLIEGSVSRRGIAAKRRIGGGPFQGEMSKKCREVRALLTVLTRRYPGLRLIWSSEAQATVELFEDLKYNKAEPDAEKAQAVKGDEHGDSQELKDKKKYNPTSRKMALKLPGVNEKNVTGLMDCAQSFYHLCICDKEDLGAYCNNSENIFNFLYKDFRSS